MRTIERMYQHLNWANHRILEALQQLEHEDREAVRLFSHILHAENVWITRLQRLDSSLLPLWSDADLDACAELVMRNGAGYKAFLDELAHADPDAIVLYKNSKDQQFSNSIRDILTHVALHGQYHRGQINSRLRAAGAEPVSLDFIVFAR